MEKGRENGGGGQWRSEKFSMEGVRVEAL